MNCPPSPVPSKVTDTHTNQAKETGNTGGETDLQTRTHRDEGTRGHQCNQLENGKHWNWEADLIKQLSAGNTAPVETTHCLSLLRPAPSEGTRPFSTRARCAQLLALAMDQEQRQRPGPPSSRPRSGRGLEKTGSVSLCAGAKTVLSPREWETEE